MPVVHFSVKFAAETFSNKQQGLRLARIAPAAVLPAAFDSKPLSNCSATRIGMHHDHS